MAQGSGWEVEDAIDVRNGVVEQHCTLLPVAAIDHGFEYLAQLRQCRLEDLGNVEPSDEDGLIWNLIGAEKDMNGAVRDIQPGCYRAGIRRSRFN
jgi:hypothetical protein